MKIQLSVSEKYYKEIEERLRRAEFEIDENAPFLLSEKEQFTSVLLLKDDKGEKVRIQTSQITFIESFGHTVMVHTENGEEYLFTDYLYKEAYSLDCGDSWTCTGIRTGIGGDKFDIQGNIMLGESCESMEQLELYVVKNEERIQDLEVEFPEVSFDTKFPAKRTDNAMLILKGIDENGYEHRRIVTMIGEFTDDYLSEERESIYNAEGSLMVGRTIPY